MNIKPGKVVSHTGAHQWGVGKVMEVSWEKATIQFSDGISRKIASSHYTSLQPADPASFSLPPIPPPAAKSRTTGRSARPKK